LDQDVGNIKNNNNNNDKVHGVAHKEKGPTTAATTGTVQQMTHHPPPASRATACGVDCGWNNEEEGQMKKKAQETLMMSLGPQVCFFFLSFHFHFTNNHFRYCFNY